jgi:hypothetical protein
VVGSAGALVTGMASGSEAAVLVATATGDTASVAVGGRLGVVGDRVAVCDRVAEGVSSPVGEALTDGGNVAVGVLMAEGVVLERVVAATVAEVRGVAVCGATEACGAGV